MIDQDNRPSNSQVVWNETVSILHSTRSSLIRLIVNIVRTKHWPSNITSLTNSRWSANLSLFPPSPLYSEQLGGLNVSGAHCEYLSHLQHFSSYLLNYILSLVLILINHSNHERSCTTKSLSTGKYLNDLIFLKIVKSKAITDAIKCYMHLIGKH